MFYGRVDLTLDAKGRLTVPAMHRDALVAQSEGRIVLTRGNHGGLIVYPRHEWELKLKELAELPNEAAPLQVLVMGSAIAVDIDSAGRILIPVTHRNLAQLERDVAWLGVGRMFQIWNVERLADFEQRAFSAEQPEVVRNFRF